MAQIMNDDSVLTRRIRALSRRQALPHAVILSGAGDRLAAARYLAAAMVCRSTGDRPCLRCTPCRKVVQDIHPDVNIVQDTERKELSVDMVRRLRQDAYIRPNEGERKVTIFADCAQLNVRDQNVLLKIVEEGPEYAAFIFCTESTAALLPTVRSRCVELKLHQEEAAWEQEQMGEFCAALSSGEMLPVTTFLVSLEARRWKREQVQELLRCTWRVAAEALLAQNGGRAAGKEAALLSRNLDNRRLLQLTELLKKYCMECDYNVGAGHILGAVCAEWEEIL